MAVAYTSSVFYSKRVARKICLFLEIACKNVHPMLLCGRKHEPQRRTSMKIKLFAATLASAAVLVMPVTVPAQESHHAAVVQTHRHDAHHHTKAKFVAGGAVGGAIIGAKVGGPVGALVGAGAGAGAGILANKAHRHHEVKKREHHETPYHQR
jgi:hypothetical protein